jgi:hypothetical protein
MGKDMPMTDSREASYTVIVYDEREDRNSSGSVRKPPSSKQGLPAV